MQAFSYNPNQLSAKKENFEFDEKNDQQSQSK